MWAILSYQDAGLSITGVPGCALIRLMCYRTWQAIKPLLMVFASAGDGQGTITGTVDWTRELQAAEAAR